MGRFVAGGMYFPLALRADASCGLTPAAITCRRFAANMERFAAKPETRNQKPGTRNHEREIPNVVASSFLFHSFDIRAVGRGQQLGFQSGGEGFIKMFFGSVAVAQVVERDG